MKHDELDPELIRLSRTKLNVRAVTAAGVAVVCLYLVVRINPDRVFGGRSLTRTTAADIVAGKVDADAFVELDAEPALASAVRAGNNKNSVGYRAAAVRGTSAGLWLVVDGDGWAPISAHPEQPLYRGRLRRLHDLALGDAVADYAATAARPAFATVAALRAGFAGPGSNRITTLTADVVQPADGDRVVIDLIDHASARVIVSLTDRMPDLAAWTSAITAAGLTPAAPLSPRGDGQGEFVVVGGDDAVKATALKLEAARLWGARVEPVSERVEGTWGAIKASPAGTLTLGGTQLADASVDLVGIYAVQPVPASAWAILVGEEPASYWYGPPVSIGLLLLAVLALWAAARAVKRDFMGAQLPEAGVNAPLI